MADIFAPDYAEKPLHMDSHGNAWKEHYTMTKTAAVNDKLYFGIIPAGIKVTDVKTVNAATQAAVTLDLGYEPANSLGVTAALTYWMTAADIAAAGSDVSAAAPIQFEHPMKLVGTIKGDDTDGAKKIDVIVTGIVVGVK